MSTTSRSTINPRGYLAEASYADVEAPGRPLRRSPEDASQRVQLKRDLPSDRTFEQLKNHYLVEKAIAQRLMRSSREERKQIYATMYDELFRKVPDHPRLARRQDDAATDRANQVKLSLIDRFLDKSKVFLEYAPGDCRFAIEVAKHVKFSYGLDISDQRRPGEVTPANFELVIYDGYSLEGIAADSIDVIFSDQLVEHFHPEDTRLHFEAAYRLLREGGTYVFRTPHAVNGPHDISKYFSDVPECFHLKEWTYSEIRRLLFEVGFSRYRSYWCRRGLMLRVPNACFSMLEKVLAKFSKRRMRSISSVLIPELFVVAEK